MTKWQPGFLEEIMQMAVDSTAPVGEAECIYLGDHKYVPESQVESLRDQVHRLRELIRDMDIEHDSGWWSRDVRKRIAAALEQNNGQAQN